MKAFWKFLKITFLIVFVLFLVALIGGVIFLKNFDIKKYKPQIIEAASEALGRAVDFKDIDLAVSLKQGIRLQLTDFVIEDDPQFSQGPFLEVEKIDVGLDILSFINARQVSVPNILVRSMRINLIRDASGAFNAQTIGQKSSRQAQTTDSNQQGQPPKAAALPAIFIDSLKVENAKINVRDLSAKQPVELSIDQLNFGVSRFSLTNPFDVFLNAAVLSPQKNMDLTGQAQLNLARQEVKLSDFRIDCELGAFALEELRRFPLLKDIALPQILKGQLKIDLKELTASASGVQKMTSDVSLMNGQFTMADVSPGVSLEANQINLKVKNFSLDAGVPFHVDFQAALFHDLPNVNFKASLSVDPKTMLIDLRDGEFTSDLSRLPLKNIKEKITLIKDAPLPQSLSGQLRVAVRELELSSEGIKKLLLDAKLDGVDVDLTGLLPGVKAKLSKTDLVVTDFSLDKPFSISLKTALFSDLPNVIFDSNVLLDLENQKFVFENTQANVDFDHFSLDALKASGLVPLGSPLPDTLGGKVNVAFKNLIVTNQGLQKILADFKWQNGKISMPEAAPGLSVNASQINIGVKDFSLSDPFSVDASLAYESDVPNINIQTGVSLDLDKQTVRLSNGKISTDLAQWSMPRLKTAIAALKDAPLPQEMSGKLDIALKELAAGPEGLSALNADVNLTNGHVKMLEAAPGVSFEASQIEAQLKNVSLSAPFSFDVSLAYLSDQTNIKTSGVLALDLKNSLTTLKDFQFSTDLSTISFDQLKASIASLKEASLPEKLKGDFDFNASQIILGPSGLKELSGQGALKNGMLKMKEFALPIEGLSTTFRITQSDVSMDTINATLGSGQIALQVAMQDYLSRQAFDMKADIIGLDLTEVLDQKKSEVKIEGLVNAKLNASGQAADTNSIIGNGSVDVQKAKLKNLNVLKTVLDKISFLPNVSARLEESLPEKYKAKLQSPDTDIKKVSLLCTIANGVINFNPVNIEADEFIFTGQAQAGFDQSYVVDGDVKIPAELSAAMAKGIEEMQYLYDDAGNISLPVHVKGTAGQMPVISVTQMALDMTKNAFRNKGKEELKKVLNKALGIEEPADQPEDATQPSTETQQEPQLSPEEQIIDGLLNTIFK